MMHLEYLWISSIQLNMNAYEIWTMFDSFREEDENIWINFDITALCSAIILPYGHFMCRSDLWVSIMCSPFEVNAWWSEQSKLISKLEDKQFSDFWRIQNNKLIIRQRSALSESYYSWVTTIFSMRWKKAVTIFTRMLQRRSVQDLNMCTYTFGASSSKDAAYRNASSKFDCEDDNMSKDFSNR